MVIWLLLTVRVIVLVFYAHPPLAKVLRYPWGLTLFKVIMFHGVGEVLLILLTQKFHLVVIDQILSLLLHLFAFSLKMKSNKRKELVLFQTKLIQLSMKYYEEPLRMKNRSLMITHWILLCQHPINIPPDTLMKTQVYYFDIKLKLS